MLEQLIYKNHLNEVFEFGKNGIYVNTSDLHDYEWDVTKKNNRITSFDYSVTKKKLPVVIICDTEAQGIAERNRLMEITEKDILALKHGQIILNGYYFRCFVSASKKKDYLTHKRYLPVTLTLTSDFPYWVKESTVSFTPPSEDSGGQNLDFPHDLPFDYRSEKNNNILVNPSFTDVNFRLIIYGACSNPSIQIAGHTYRVDCDVAENEYLTIDSISKTITVTANNGAVTNVFKNRYRDSYIFEKIPTGQNSVSWEGDFGFDVVMLEERSEPKWT